MATNPDLPQEIMLEIFSRIPAKSVGKCRTLSKSWKFHLSTNNFIKKHLINRKQIIQQPNLALIMKRDEDDDEPVKEVCIVTSPTKKDEAFNRIRVQEEACFIGSCNGLILLQGIDGDSYYLVNPITFKQVNIQVYDLGFYLGFLALGYDSCSDDYKIVEISIKRFPVVVSVYSVKTGVWKRLDDCYPYNDFLPTMPSFEGGVFVNGAVHWLISSPGEYRCCVAAFDLANEVFREIDLPKGFVRQQAKAFDSSSGVSIVGGCLTVVDDHGGGTTDVWMMKEYGVEESWVKFRIQAVNNQWLSIDAIMCYVEDGELLFLTSRNDLFAYDLKEGTARKVVLGGFDNQCSHGIAFVDSLVSPEGSW